MIAGTQRSDLLTRFMTLWQASDKANFEVSDDDFVPRRAHCMACDRRRVAVCEFSVGVAERYYL